MSTHFQWFYSTLPPLPPSLGADILYGWPRSSIRVIYKASWYFCNGFPIMYKVNWHTCCNLDLLKRYGFTKTSLLLFFPQKFRKFWVVSSIRHFFIKWQFCSCLIPFLKFIYSLTSENIKKSLSQFFLLFKAFYTVLCFLII